MGGLSPRQNSKFSVPIVFFAREKTIALYQTAAHKVTNALRILLMRVEGVGGGLFLGRAVAPTVAVSLRQFSKNPHIGNGNKF